MAQRTSNGPDSHAASRLLFRNNDWQETGRGGDRLIVYVYVLGHLAGNLLIYGGRDVINNYAHLLHDYMRVRGYYGSLE
jgi:hypothetical protein